MKVVLTVGLSAEPTVEHWAALKADLSVVLLAAKLVGTMAVSTVDRMVALLVQRMVVWKAEYLVQLLVEH